MAILTDPPHDAGGEQGLIEVCRHRHFQRDLGVHIPSLKAQYDLGEMVLSLVLHWPSVPLLLRSMLLFGASMSLYDVSINTEGSALEVLGKRAIMGNLHGMFSVGRALRAGVAAALRD
jgi:hypothetical protein